MGTLKEIFALFGTKNLLDIIKIEEKDAEDEKKLKSAYLKAALMYHPDKTGPGSDKVERTKQFQLLKQIYQVLGVKESREEYFRTGKWPEYEAGNVEDWIGRCGARLDINLIEEFKKTYQGSQEERDDIKKYYNLGSGSEIILFDSIPFVEYLEDASMERIRELVKDMIEKEEIEKFDRRDESRKIKARISKAQKEKAELEEIQKEEEANKEAEAKNGGGGDSLELQIRNRHAQRSNDFIAQMEEKYKKEKNGKGKDKSKRDHNGKKKTEEAAEAEEDVEVDSDDEDYVEEEEEEETPKKRSKPSSSSNTGKSKA